MSEQLERQIRSAVIELVESSPPPHPVHRVLEPSAGPRSPLPLRSGLVRMAAVAIVVLVVGLAGAWIGRNIGPSVIEQPGAWNPEWPVVEGMLGPEPGFDADVFGDEAALLPPGGELHPEIQGTPPGVPDGEVVAVGGIPGTDFEVFTWESTEGETCLQIVGESSRDSMCGIDSQDWVTDPSNIPPGTDFADPPGLFWTTPTGSSSDATDVMVATPVPDGTSIMVLEANGERMWQRPRGGVWALSLDPDTPRLTISAWNANQEHIGTTMFLPSQAIDPVEQGETELEGAPEDLVEIGESHPVAQILSEGPTAEEFADEMEASCLDGGPPEFRFCELVLDGTLVIVPFEGEPGLTARISDPGLVRDVVIPLDRSESVGVDNLTRPEVDVHIEYLGEEISMSRTRLSE